MAEEKKPEKAVSPEYARALEAEKKDPTSISNLIDPRAMMVDQGYDFGLGREMLSLLPWLSQLDARDKPGERMIAPELAGMPADQAEEYMPAQAQAADYPPWLAGKAARENMNERKEEYEKGHPLAAGAEELVGALHSPQAKALDMGTRALSKAWAGLDEWITRALASGGTNAVIQGAGGFAGGQGGVNNRLAKGAEAAGIGALSGLVAPLASEKMAELVQRYAGRGGHAVIKGVDTGINYFDKGMDHLAELLKPRQLAETVEKDINTVGKDVERGVAGGVRNIETALGPIPEHAHKARVQQAKELIDRAAQGTARVFDQHFESSAPLWIDTLKDKVSEKGLEQTYEKTKDTLEELGHAEHKEEKKLEGDFRKEFPKRDIRHKTLGPKVEGGRMHWVPDPRIPGWGHLEYRPGGVDRTLQQIRK